MERDVLLLCQVASAGTLGDLFIELLYRTDRYMSAAAKMFISLIEKHFADQVKNL